MVTLLGFFFILANVGLLVLIMPDLIGPVSCFRLPLCPARLESGLTRERYACYSGAILVIL